MIFVPHIIHCADQTYIQIDISLASVSDMSATRGSPRWQTN